MRAKTCVHNYRICGLAIASEVALPCARRLFRSTATPDVIIRRGAVPLELAMPQANGATWAMAGECFLLRVPGVVRFLVVAGREIVFETEAGTLGRDATIFLLGTPFGMVLHQRRQIVLHASAVAVSGTAVLFCGPSGAGKSTLAAALSERGYRFLNDDVCALNFDCGRPRVHPDGRLLKLWAHALEALMLGPRKGDKVSSRFEKYYVAPINRPPPEPLPLGGIYYLREATPRHAPGIERLAVLDALALLRSNVFRPEFISQMGLEPSTFTQASAVLRHAGVFYLTRPLGFKAMPNTIAWLTAHWRDLGLGCNRQALVQRHVRQCR
jgi:hypothetical protein